MKEKSFGYICNNKSTCSMKMYTRAFNDMREANTFVNEHGIAKDQIVNIFPAGDGTYLLVYYAE